jgi:hypothetical protein
MKRTRAWLVAGVAAFAGGLGAAQAQECADTSACGSFEGCIDGVCTPVEPGDQPCESDVDCDDGVCLDGFCWTASEAPPPVDCEPGDPACAGDCADDADCGPGGVCLPGGFCSFEDEGGGEAGECAADADCGDGMVCLGCFCQPAEGTCASDDECGPSERCEVPDVAVGGFGDDDGEAVECSFDRGWCVIDPEKVEADPRCETFCDALGECGEGTGPVEGGGSGGGGFAGTDEGGAPDEGFDTDEGALSDDERAECVVYCSYLMQDEDVGEALADLVSCVEAHRGDACDALAERCGDEVEAVAEASDDVAVGVGDSGGAQAGGSGGAERGSAGDLFRGFFDGGGDGDSANGGGKGGGSGGGGSGEDGGGDGGCAVAPSASTQAVGMLVVGLLGLLNGRRRRR